MRARIELAVAIAADGNPTPLIELYQGLTTRYGHQTAATLIQRYGVEVFV